MNFTQIKKSILNAFITSGYSRTATELLQFTDRQLEDLGISRELLRQGPSAFPWRDEKTAQEIPNNVSSINSAKGKATTPILPKTPKAA